MMPMTEAFFPPTQRVHYARSPLTEVVCQLRFPPVLRIEGELPATFQERIRELFPLFERGPAMPQLPPEIAQMLPQMPSVNYLFRTEDKTTTLNLTKEAIGLSTSRYEGWERFRECFYVALRALNEIYRPSYFTRIGLRYTDTIERSKLGLDNVPWSELLRREILGEMAIPEFEQNVEAMQRVIRLRFPDGSGSILLISALVPGQHPPEQAYRLDFDSFVERKTDVQHAEPLLDRFNRRAGNAFRWCITDRLHRALEPAAASVEPAHNA